MITQEKRNEVIERSMEFFKKSGIVITEAEKQELEVADFGLNQVEETGLEVLVYINGDRYCAKELVILPRQTCPEHRHPPLGALPGKQETFRCRWGEVYLYVPGEPTPNPKAVPPASRKDTYTVFHEIVLRPGDQYTLKPDTLHWFQAGEMGAVVSEFSSASHDDSDFFTDPEIQRITQVAK